LTILSVSLSPFAGICKYFLIVFNDIQKCELLGGSWGGNCSAGAILFRE
jgi:hypothetical protein